MGRGAPLWKYAFTPSEASMSRGQRRTSLSNSSSSSYPDLREERSTSSTCKGSLPEEGARNPYSCQSSLSEKGARITSSYQSVRSQARTTTKDDGMGALRTGKMHAPEVRQHGCRPRWQRAEMQGGNKHAG